MIRITRVSYIYANRVLAEINRLLPQLSPSGQAVPLTLEELQECLDNKNFYLFTASENFGGEAPRLLGMGSIFFQRNLGRWIAEIHDIVVDSQQRGYGLGEKIVRRLLEEAETFAFLKRKPIKLYLTSRPRRLAANQLYLKLGFKIVAEATGEWGTNLYKMMIRSQPDTKNPVSS